jgi:hypothetical protein
MADLLAAQQKEATPRAAVRNFALFCDAEQASLMRACCATLLLLPLLLRGRTDVVGCAFVCGRRPVRLACWLCVCACAACCVLLLLA